MERFVQFPTGDNWTFTWDSPILWKQLNLARYLVLSTWYLVSGTGTWTQPVLGQDFTVLWLATLGRGINIMMRRSGRPAGARCYASLYWFPYQESVSQILEKKNQDFTGSAPDSLRATYWPGYVLTGLCIHVVAVLYEVLSTSTWLWLLYHY